MRGSVANSPEIARTTVWTLQRKLIAAVTAFVALAFIALVVVHVPSERERKLSAFTWNKLTITKMLARQIVGGVRWRKASAVDQAFANLENDQDSMLAGYVILDSQDNLLLYNDSASLVYADLSNAAALAQRARDQARPLVDQGPAHTTIAAPLVIAKNGKQIGTLVIAWSRESLSRQLSEELRHQIWLAIGALFLLAIIMYSTLR